MFAPKSNPENFDPKSYFFNELSKIIKPSCKNNGDSKTLSDNSISEKQTQQNIIIYSNNNDNNDNNDNNINNVCLITKDILHPNHITLSCGHKFNYLPLYKEVANQKNKTNIAYETTKLDNHQIKCPYCRTITNKLLPYIPYTSVKLIKYVNCPEEHCMTTLKCSHIIRRRNKTESNSDENADSNNENNNQTTSESTQTTVKTQGCDKNAIYYEDEKVLFCQHHYKLYKKKSDHILAKNKKTINNSVHMQSNTSDKKCNAILKTGKNSGKKCFNITNGSLYCKRHASLVKE